jgi:hypothetical protein
MLNRRFLAVVDCDPTAATIYDAGRRASDLHCVLGARLVPLKLLGRLFNVGGPLPL